MAEASCYAIILILGIMAIIVGAAFNFTSVLVSGFMIFLLASTALIVEGLRRLCEAPPPAPNVVTDATAKTEPNSDDDDTIA